MAIYSNYSYGNGKSYSYGSNSAGSAGSTGSAGSANTSSAGSVNTPQRNSNETPTLAYTTNAPSTTGVVGTPGVTGSAGSAGSIGSAGFSSSAGSAAIVELPVESYYDLTPEQQTQARSEAVEVCLLWINLSKLKYQLERKEMLEGFQNERNEMLDDFNEFRKSLGLPNADSSLPTKEPSLDDLRAEVEEAEKKYNTAKVKFLNKWGFEYDTCPNVTVI